MAEFPALPLWTDAYLGDTTHLTTIQHGIYLLLLFAAWRSKGCVLPDDDGLLARYAHLTTQQWARHRPTISAFFTIENGKWSNGRLSDEMVAVKRHRDQRSTAGIASALKRQHRNATVVAQPFNGRIAPYSYSLEVVVSKEVSSKKDAAPEIGAAPAKQKRGMSLPPDFPSEKEADQARQFWGENLRPDLGPRVWEIAAAFCDHHKSRGTASKDWPASWRTWMRNALKFERNNTHGSGKPPGANDKFLAGGAALIREFEAENGDGDSQNADPPISALLSP